MKLATWERLAEADPLTPRAVEQMVLVVSTRNYARSIEPPPPGVATRGTSKSAVSRRFVAATREALDTMLSRDLSKLGVCVVMIDGIRVGEHLVLVALGIDADGQKHILGLYEGATENTTACLGLLSDLEARGMVSPAGSLLFVIDGSKALAKAIRSTFGRHALVQRCEVHKRRNVEDHLPEAAKRTHSSRSTRMRLSPHSIRQDFRASMTSASGSNSAPLSRFAWRREGREVRPRNGANPAGSEDS